MKYTRKTTVGNYAKKGIDIKQDDIVLIASEGQEVDGNFGKQDVFLLKLATGEEKNVNLNQTSINNLIDAYGDDSKNWIGKEAKVWLIPQMVSGKMAKVLYLAHPKAFFNDDGQFDLELTSDGSINAAGSKF